ncbi:MAG: stage II sporulation protein M [Desulfobulbaceae bacterium]|nr:stage II sporulation protein M [Desulfobulbaceae bacterium]
MLLYAAWKALLFAFLLTFAISFAAGIILITIIDISPEAIYQISSKRISYIFPVIESGVKAGIDPGLLIFLWNSLGALATISFIYTATFFDPHKISRFPRGLRKIFCGRTRMKIFCFLPGCQPIAEESLRRLYVWLMVPLLGMILLGVETGFSVSTSTFLFDSAPLAFISLLPHGIIEIPAIALAGAVSFSAHLLMQEETPETMTDEMFGRIEAHKKELPIMLIGFSVLLSLFSAGLIEAHVTGRIMALLS